MVLDLFSDFFWEVLIFLTLLLLGGSGVFLLTSFPLPVLPPFSDDDADDDCGGDDDDGVGCDSGDGDIDLFLCLLHFLPFHLYIVFLHQVLQGSLNMHQILPYIVLEVITEK